MSKDVTSLVSELEAKGWSSTRTDDQLIFIRDGVVITGYPEHVSARLGDFYTSKRADRYQSTMGRLDFLLQQIHHFAEMYDNGTMSEMARWDAAEKAIRTSSWEQVLMYPEALKLVEQAVEMLRSNSV